MRAPHLCEHCGHLEEADPEVEVPVCGPCDELLPAETPYMVPGWDVVAFSSTWDTTVHQRTASWDRLVEVLTTFRTHHGDKMALPGWSPARYTEGATRGKDGVQALSCLVLDYDDGTTIEEALQAWQWRPGILHTSWSHTEEHHRFRVVLPLAQPVAAADWPGVFAWADRWTRRCTNEEALQVPEDYHRATWQSTIDQKCKDPGRFYFVPAVRAEDWPRVATSWRPAGGYLGTHLPWSRDLARYKAEQARRAQRPRLPPRERVTSNVADKRIRYRLQWSPAARVRLGERMGGKGQGDRVRGGPCPGCGRAEVWWFITPDRKTRAECNHTGQSCGWTGSLMELAEA